jgi:alpha-1,6-mannosyltransferase
VFFLASKNRFLIWLSGGLLIYILFAAWFPLFPHVSHVPPYDVRSFTPSMRAGLSYVLLISAAFIVYRTAVRAAPARLSLPLILASTALLAAPLLLAYPINATDVYRYVIRGRVQSAYGANPYLTPPAVFANDPLLPLAGEWASEVSPYGPLWELTAGGVTAVTVTNISAGILLFKLIALTAHLAVILLIWHYSAAAKPSVRQRRVLLWAWNPALLLMFIVDAHNDVVMLFWLVGGAILLLKKRHTAGMLLLTIAPLIKPIALLAIPIFFVYGWREQPDLTARFRFLAGTTGGGLGLAFLAFLPYGSPWALGARLLREATQSPGFSPTALLFLTIDAWGGRIPITQVGHIARILLLFIFLWLLWRVWHGRSPLRSSADLFVAYIVQAFSFRIWYTTWPFPLLLLDQSDSAKTESRLQAGLWFLFNAQLSVFIYGHLWRYFLEDHFRSHLIGIPFVFLLPILLTSVRKWDW